MSRTEMNCAQVRDLLEGYFEGALSGARQRQVADHLSRCAACAAQLAQIEKVAAALAAVPRAEPGVELLRAMSARTAALPPPDGRRAFLSGWRRLGLVAAACMAVLAAVHFALPVVGQRAAELLAPALTWLRATALDALPRMTSAIAVAQTMLEAAKDVAQALGLAAAALAPVLALYAAAEIVLIATLLLALRWARRKAPLRLPVIVL